MTLTPRNKAIATMWVHKEKQGWTVEKMDEEIMKTGIVKDPSISCMSGKQIGKILFSWGYSMVVAEPKEIYKLLKQCEKYKIPWEIVVGTVKHKLGKKIGEDSRDRDPSVWHLLKWEKTVGHRYIWVLTNRVVKFYINNPDKITHRDGQK